MTLEERLMSKIAPEHAGNVARGVTWKPITVTEIKKAN